MEDHADTLSINAIVLRRQGYDVSTAHTKAEALRLCEIEHFDLLIGDLGLPDGSGLDLLRQIIAKYPIIGIAYTGRGSDSDLAASRAAGYSAHLTKPTDLKVLLDTIDKLLA